MNSKLIPYTTDDEYRESLLSLFGFNEYTDELTQCILDLYKPLQHLVVLHHIIDILEQSCPLCNKETAFLLMFSYDLLPSTHAFIVEYTETKSLNALVELEKKVSKYTI